MGVFTRKGSPWWHLWLESAPDGQKLEKTSVRIGTTVTDRTESRRLAEAVYRKRMDELAARIHRLPTATPTIRFNTYAETYARDVIAHHKGAEREREMLKGLVAFFGSDSIDKIDRPRVQRWMIARRAQVSASTVNRELDLLKSMLRDAAPTFLTASPIAGLKRLHSVQPRRRLLSTDEERRLLAAAKDPEDRALIVLGIDTLVRLGDLLDLRRDDRQGVWIYIRDPKGGEPYEVPLSPRAARALDRIRHDSPFYFRKFRQAKNPRDWRSAVRHRLQKLCAAAVPPVPFGKAVGGITFHWATRRTGATRLLIAKKQPVSVVQQLGKWKTPDVLLNIYAEAQRDDLLRAVGQRALPIRSQKRRKG